MIGRQNGKDKSSLERQNVLSVEYVRQTYRSSLSSGGSRNIERGWRFLNYIIRCSELFFEYYGFLSIVYFIFHNIPIILC